MFDLKDIRDNPEAYKTAWNRKASGLGDETVPEILRLDEALRAVVGRKQEAEQARNTNSKLIGKAKGQGDEAEAQRLMAVVAEAKATIESAGEEEARVQSDLNAILMGTPNVPMSDVPEGEDEAENIEQHKWGDPNARLKGRNQILDHADLGAALKNKLGQPLMDFEAAATMSGARFVALRGDLARLERALASFMLDQQTQQNGYEEVSPPLLVRDNALEGTGQLPKFSEDLFKFITEYSELISSEQFIRALQGQKDTLNILAEEIVRMGEQHNYPLKEVAKRKEILILAKESDEEVSRLREKRNQRFQDLQRRGQTNLYTIPTAEVPLTNLVREQILATDQLPMRMTAHTPCFRSEAGSAGRDTKGMIRLHQFNKVEMVSIVRDEDEGLAELERMTKCAEGILEALGLTYRRMLLCTGDMGFGARKTYDLEVWLPSQNTYREISSCSYCGDFQARRMKARCRPEPSDENPKPKPEFVHTLNGSGLAVGRTLVAVLENYQNEDGSIEIPEVLRPYMGGQEVVS